MFKIVRKRKAHFPELPTDKKLLGDIGKIAAFHVSKNISDRRTADGGSIKRNAKKYAAWKAAKGWGTKPLVAENESFVRTGKNTSFVWEVTRRAVVIRPSKVLRSGAVAFNNLSRWVQKAGYVGWFGLSKKGEADIRARIKKYIKDSFKKAAAKS